MATQSGISYNKVTMNPGGVTAGGITAPVATTAVAPAKSAAAAAQSSLPTAASLKAPVVPGATTPHLNVSAPAAAASPAQGFWSGLADKGKSAGSWAAKTGKDAGGWMKANKGKTLLIAGGVAATTAVISNMGARSSAIDQQLANERYGGRGR